MKRIALVSLFSLLLFSLPGQSFKINASEFEAGQSYTSWGIHFVMAKHDLQLEPSKPSLDSISVFLKNNPTVVVELGYHTNMRGNPESNVEFSLHRAEAVQKYLVQQGIEAGRMEVKGYGSGQPILSKEEEKKNATAWNNCEPPNPPCIGNRRLTVKILKK